MIRILDRKFIRENPDVVRAAIEAKDSSLILEDLLDADTQVRSFQHQVDQATGQKKVLSRAFAQADDAGRKDLRDEITRLDTVIESTAALLAVERERLESQMLSVPQIPWSGAPIGPDEHSNVVVRTVGEVPEFSFEPLDHVALAEKRGWAEFARARRVSGERGYALRGDLLLLERAIHSWALDVLNAAGFEPIGVPALVREQALVGTGMLPKGREEIYELPADGLFLAGTAEVGLVGMHSDQILSHADLPLRYAGISPCFRREIGSSSRDVRGLLRVHQFEKVEQFVICEASETTSALWHGTLLASAEHLLQELGLAYEVVECSTGDMGLGKYRMNDINTWFPSLDTYRETHSCSTLHDWQARRANLRYRDAEGKIRFAHTLNNTAVATPRLLAAIIENHQREDGSVLVPKAIRRYIGDRDYL